MRHVFDWVSIFIGSRLEGLFPNFGVLECSHTVTATQRYRSIGRIMDCLQNIRILGLAVCAIG